MATYPDHVFWVPIVAFQERIQGWNALLKHRKNSRQIVRSYAGLERTLSIFSVSQVASYDAHSEDVFLQFRADGLRIGTMDLRIASIALTRDFTLLTRNAVDFDKVPGLRHEDWTLPHRPK